MKKVGGRKFREAKKKYLGRMFVKYQLIDLSVFMSFEKASLCPELFSNVRCSNLCENLFSLAETLSINFSKGCQG